MVADVTIRKATVDDLPALLPLFRDYQAHHGALTTASEEHTREVLRSHLQDGERGFVLVAISGGGLVGFAGVYLTASGLIAERIAHLGDLFVVSEQRRKGIATHLFEAVSRESAERGISLVRWLSLEANSKLNEWYGRLVPPAGTFQLFLRPTGARRA